MREIEVCDFAWWLKHHGVKPYHAALAMKVSPATITTLIRGEKELTIPLAIKIERYTGMNAARLMVVELQKKIEKERQNMLTDLDGVCIFGS